MKNFPEPIKKLLNHYARAIDDHLVCDILTKGTITSESEAKGMLDFLDKMSSQIAKDAKSGVVVLRQVVHTHDAEKVCMDVESYLVELGYDDLIND